MRAKRFLVNALGVILLASAFIPNSVLAQDIATPTPIVVPTEVPTDTPQVATETPFLSPTLEQPTVIPTEVPTELSAPTEISGVDCSKPQWPVEGMTKPDGHPFGTSTGYESSHTGEDWVKEWNNQTILLGVNVFPVFNGTVIYTGNWPAGSGSPWVDTVIVRTECSNGRIINLLYEHLNMGSKHAEVGEEVIQGNALGEIGQCHGFCSQPHLHLGLFKDGIDPLKGFVTDSWDPPMTLFTNETQQPVTQQGSDYIIPTNGASSGCAFNIRHGLEMYAPGGSRPIKSGESVYFNLSGMGKMDESAGFKTLFNPANGKDTPAGCLCDLATYLYHAAQQSGLQVGYDEAGHEKSLGNIIGNPPKPWIIIWHVADYDPKNPSTKPAGEEDFWITNTNQYDISFHWEDTPDGNIRTWFDQSSQVVASQPQQPDITKACVFLNPFHDGKSIQDHEVVGKGYPGDNSIPADILNGEVYPMFPATLSSYSQDSLTLDGIVTCQNWEIKISGINADKNLAGKTGQLVDASLLLGSGEFSLSLGHLGSPADGLESFNGQLVGDTYWYNPNLFADKQYDPGQIEEKPVKTIADLPFVDDVRNSNALTTDLNAKPDITPKAVIWNQTDTGPTLPTGETVTGLSIAKTEKLEGNTTPGYNVVCGLDTVNVDGESFASCQWLVDTKTQAVQDVNRSASLSLAYVNESAETKSPTPAQLNSLEAITAVWLEEFNIPVEQVITPGDNSGSTVTGVDIDKEREKLKSIKPITTRSALKEINVAADSQPQVKWVDLSRPLTDLEKLGSVLWTGAPLLFVILIVMASVTYKSVRRTDSRTKWSGKWRLITWLNVVGVVGLMFGYLYCWILYQPVAPRPEVLRQGKSYSPATINTPEPKTNNVQDTNTDPVWQKIAAEAKYGNPRLLEDFCTTYNYPRGPSGDFLSTDEGGKLFPCETAAAIPMGETNTSQWNNADPRQPGPWGKFIGWNEAPDYFPRTPLEIAQGKTLSSLAQACRDGLEAIASNQFVQAKFPGITAQGIYTSDGCAVGRGQTLALHFRSGGLAADLRNKDVWSNNEAATEVIYRHLVSRFSKGCGNGSWFSTGNVETALCSYNPNSWGVASDQWYWDSIREQAKKIRTAIDDHKSELAGEVDIAPPVEKPQPKSEPNTGQGSAVEIQSGNDLRPTVGSGPYAIWDTIPSWTLLQIRKLPDNRITSGIENALVKLGKFAYGRESQINLGFTKP